MIANLTKTVLFVFGITTGLGAWANSAYTDLMPEHWFEAMEIGGVDSEILYAIALTESGNSFNGMREYGPWPWTLNVNGEAKFYASREAARRALQKEVDKGNEKVAVGMFQIYLKYNSHYAENPVDLLDPVVNLYAGSMVLRDCGKRYDTTRDVLSCYYSGDVDEAGLDYAERVLRKANRWGRPFRLSGSEPAVRFTHAESADQSGDGSVKTQEASPVSLVAIAKSKGSAEVEDHKSFMNHIENERTMVSHRVITVE